jgi:hypothetical protein
MFSSWLAAVGSEARRGEMRAGEWRPWADSPACVVVKDDLGDLLAARAALRGDGAVGGRERGEVVRRHGRRDRLWWQRSAKEGAKDAGAEAFTRFGCRADPRAGHRPQSRRPRAWIGQAWRARGSATSATQRPSWACVT